MHYTAMYNNNITLYVADNLSKKIIIIKTVNHCVKRNLIKNSICIIYVYFYASCALRVAQYTTHVYCTNI